ncbi:MAG: hypothetical protein SNJ82_03600, partial [Gemmataceae bacterium]
MIPSDIVNPFEVTMADNTMVLPKGDVPEIHEDIYRAYLSGLESARLHRHGVSVLSVGEKGSGKSHLIARLRQHLDKDPHAVLVMLPLSEGYLNRLWIPVRQHLFEGLLYPYQYQGAGKNGLLRILENRFPAWASAVRGGSSVLDIIMGNPSAQLRPHLEAFASSCPLHYDFVKVLPQLCDQAKQPLVEQWLRGHSLGEADLQTLGLAPKYPSDLEREITSKSIVQSLLRLAGDKTTLVLCFDNLESIQAGNSDSAVLKQFATMVVDL